MRLITRSDFDGLVCAVLLQEVEQIDSVEFVHPKDVQDGKISVGPNDILTNLPYQNGIGLWFDHHSSEIVRNQDTATYRGRFEIAPSAARVVFNYYGAATLGKYAKLLESVDKSDAAQLTMDEVMRPEGWILLSYVMDPRTGLAYHRDYAISNRELMTKMITLIAQHPDDPDTVLADPDVKERTDRYHAQQKDFEQYMREHSRLEGNVIITDLRNAGEPPAGNRFLIYTMFPEANIQVRVFEGRRGEFVVCAVGHSIFNRTSKTDVGKLMDHYSGGGHRGAGTCQLPLAEAEAKLKEIVETIKKDG
ncbi:MAG TPA: exopolyphosphatase [Thermoanaerobaculia bacterium]|jgi:nanoRNase/pAp phosphatase (c-di-AMP/oligoRNAs hydrolase)|nr:exopolyphosphatase [Thermoanaerobaculia bacterium]